MDKSQPVREGAVVLACYDDNRRKHTTLLGHSAKKAGASERVLIQQQPDEIKLIMPKGYELQSNATFRFDAFVEKKHGAIASVFTIEGTKVGVIFFNSGRTKSKRDVEASLERVSKYAKGLREECDIVFVVFVEFGEGDVSYYDEHKIAREKLGEQFTQFVEAPSKETIFVGRGSKTGVKVDKTHRVPGTSVAHQSPNRPVHELIIRHGLPFSLHVVFFHSAAGAYNGHRPHSVWQKLVASWNRTNKKATEVCSDAVLGKT